MLFLCHFGSFFFLPLTTTKDLESIPARYLNFNGTGKPIKANQVTMAAFFDYYVPRSEQIFKSSKAVEFTCCVNSAMFSRCSLRSRLSCESSTTAEA